MRTKIGLILCLLALIGIYAVIIYSVYHDPPEMYRPPYEIFRKSD